MLYWVCFSPICPVLLPFKRPKQTIKSKFSLFDVNRDLEATCESELYAEYKDKLEE